MNKNLTLKWLFISLIFINHVAFAATITWNGSVSTDWHTSANWTGGLPTSTDDVIIPVAMPRYPIISANVNILSLNLGVDLPLTIPVGITVNIAEKLSCFGNITNFGTLDVNASTDLNNTGSITNKNGALFDSYYVPANGHYGVSLTGTAVLTNETGGIVNITGGSAGVYINGSGTNVTMLSNSGTMNITGGIEKYNNNIINDGCGQMFLIRFSNFYSGKIINQAGMVTNNGYLNIANDLTNNAGAGNFVNNSLIKVGGTVGTFTNNKLRLKNSPANNAFMVIGAGNDLVVNGIFTDVAATISAGTFSLATNTFTPGTLPSGSQTLYVKVIGGSCTYIVPITYLPIPVFTAQYTDRNICTGASEILTLSATDATVYQWFSSPFSNMSSPTSLSVTGGSTTILGNVSFNNQYLRCTALNNTGSVFSDIFRVFVSPAVTAPSAVSASKNNLCNGVSTSLSATCAVGTVKWYSQVSGGSLLGTGSPYSVSPVATITYFVACENTACYSSRVSQGITVVNASATQTLVSPANDISTDAGILLAGNNITASNKIEPSGKATYQTGNFVQLNAGFEAKAGAVFQAIIQAICTN